MPIYEFQCKKCGSIKEELRSIERADDRIYCIYCTLLMDRIISKTNWKWKDGQWRGSAQDKLDSLAKNGWKKEE